ncbi:hypothetical protein V6N13_143796 [Hibiscus sabdariffa]|uniref:Uncharacterized protein n=1 Tax=Hibiscus sabdariffa TaxID=183260 RepID=A0ABR2FJ17_9ROSI
MAATCSRGVKCQYDSNCIHACRKPFAMVKLVSIILCLHLNLHKAPPNRVKSEDGRFQIRYLFDSHDADGGCSAVFESARDATVAASSCLHWTHLRFRVGRHFHLPFSCLQRGDED